MSCDGIKQTSQRGRGCGGADAIAVHKGLPAGCIRHHKVAHLHKVMCKTQYLIRGKMRPVVPCRLCSRTALRRSSARRT